MTSDSTPAILQFLNSPAPMILNCSCGYACRRRGRGAAIELYANTCTVQFPQMDRHRHIRGSVSARLTLKFHPPVVRGFKGGFLVFHFFVQLHKLQRFRQIFRFAHLLFKQFYLFLKFCDLIFQTCFFPLDATPFGLDFFLKDPLFRRVHCACFPVFVR